MNIIGLTGNIASGKSTVSKILNQLGFYIIDGDKIGHKIMKNSETLKDIIDAFGEHILTNDKRLNRAALGKIVFNDKNKLILLNNITKPYILKEIVKEINMALKKNVNTIFIDGAVLFEFDIDKCCNKICCVYCNSNVQLERLMKRNNLTQSEALTRINSQISTETLLAKCNYHICNDKDLDELNKNIHKFLKHANLKP